MKDYITGDIDPLSDPIIKSYYESNINLARTIAIKSPKSADQLNQYLIEKYGEGIVNQSDPTTWKYYMNLAGLYHPTDTVMTITSLDTLLPITFDKTTLASHPNTKNEYRYGTRYYQTLVNRFPDQEDLIMGILMPCDITTAINAEHGDILRWDTTLVESNEYSLIKNLEDAIKLHIKRWYVDAYSAMDSYYLMYYYSLLSCFILMKILNLRDGKRNHYEVHSFHVRMLLKGYKNLDQYYQYMTHKQSMYFYRNLLRLSRNVGYNSQYKELTENVLTERDIQLFNYTLRQTNQISSDLWPNSVVRSEPVNKVQTDPRIETITPEELFRKEETVVYGTAEYYDVEEDNVIFQIRTEDQARVPTKDVITQTEDKISIFPLTFEDVLIRHWGYLAGIGLYTAPVTFQNPRTGVFQTVSAKVAFSYMYYLCLSYTTNDLATDLSKNVLESDLAQMVKIAEVMAQKIPVTIVPKFLSEHHVALSEPTVSYLLTVVETDLRDDLQPVAQALLDQFVAISATNTTDLFYNLCVNIYKGYMYQNGIVDSFQDLTQRGCVKNMMYRLYKDTMVELYPSTMSIEEFLQQNNLDPYSVVGSNNIAKLVTNLFDAGTGSNSNTSSNQKFITQAMISIMRALSSYNIQYIDIINETDLTPIRTEPNIINGYMNTGDDEEVLYPNHIVHLPVGVFAQDVTSVYL